MHFSLLVVVIAQNFQVSGAVHGCWWCKFWGTGVKSFGDVGMLLCKFWDMRAKSFGDVGELLMRGFSRKSRLGFGARFGRFTSGC